MTPKASQGGRATGTSFKGVFAYLQHDKRLEGEQRRDTTERVAWQEFRNLMTDDPDTAWRIMMATAKQQDALKQQAGQSAAGNKSDKVVFHYSLGWHPDEAAGLTKAEMLRAANESIRALGAEGHQAAIIAHNDTAHPHLHVVINRVNPENGKMLDLWGYQKRLSKWAMAYEQERGKVWCDKRVENWKRRDLGEVFSADTGEAYHRHDQAALGHANDNDIREILADQKAQDAILAKAGESMNARHTQQWKDLSAWYAEGKARIAGRNAGDAPTPFQKIRADIKEQYRPVWRELFSKQWQEQKAFEKRERHLSGKLENAIAAVRHASALGRDDSKGFVAMAFNFLTSSKARADALQRLHAAQRNGLSGRQKADVGAAIAKLKRDQQTAFKAHRERFNAKRDSLKADQADEKRDLRQKWQDRHQERERVLSVVRRMETIKQERSTSQEASRGQYREEFNKAAAPEKRRRKGRVRKRQIDE